MNSTLLKTRNEFSEEIGEVRNELVHLNRKQEEAFNEKFTKTDHFYQTINDDIYKVNQQIQNILEERRSDIEETAKFVKNISVTTKKEIQITTDRLSEEIEDLKKTSEELIQRKLEKKDFLESRQKLVGQIEAKVDLTEVQNALNTTQNDLATKFIEYKDEVKSMVHSHEHELFSMMNKKVNLSDFNSAINQKVDANVMNGLLSQKASIHELEDLGRKIEHQLRNSDDRVSYKGKCERWREKDK